MTAISLVLVKLKNLHAAAMASIRFNLPPVVLAAKSAPKEDSFLDWLDNAFQKKAGLKETSDSKRS